MKWSMTRGMTPFSRLFMVTSCAGLCALGLIRASRIIEKGQDQFYDENEAKQQLKNQSEVLPPA